MKTFITLITFLVANSLLSQTPEWDNIQFNNDVCHIDKKDSIVWAVTSAGIVKLNANTNKSRLYNRANTPLSGNWQDISAIAIDSYGNFWAGYSDFKVDRITENGCENYNLIEILDLYNVSSFRTYLNSISEIIVNRDGRVNFWINSAGFATYENGNWHHHLNDELNYNYCFDFDLGKDDKLVSLHGAEYLIYHSEDSVEIVNVPGYDGLLNVLYSIEVCDSTVLLGDDSGRLKSFDGDTTILLEHFKSNGPAMKVYEIDYNQKLNIFYIELFGDVLVLYDGEKFWEPPFVNELARFAIFAECFYPDTDGIIWMGSNNGIFSENIERYSKESRIPDNAIYDVFPNGKDVYVATASEIKRFNSGEWFVISADKDHYGRKSNFVKYKDGVAVSTQNSILFIKNDEVITYDYPWNYKATFTHKICADEENIYIAGTDKFFIFDGTNISTIDYDDGKNSSYKDNYMKSCFVAKDGNVWICCAQKIFRYNGFNIDEKVFSGTEPEAPYINVGLIDGCLWMLTYEGAYKEEDGNFIKYDFGLDYGTWHENIMDIIPAEDGNMWVIANKPRLWDGEKFIDSVDYSNSGIHYENIEGMRKDKYGNLWFFDSNKGISMYRKGGINSVEDLPFYNPEVYIYPNPASGKINFELPEEFNAKEARIFDIEGRIVFETELSGNELNLNTLPCGSYIIEFSDKKTIISKKVEIVR